MYVCSEHLHTYPNELKTELIVYTPSAFVSNANVEIHPYKCGDEFLFPHLSILEWYYVLAS